MQPSGQRCEGGLTAGVGFNTNTNQYICCLSCDLQSQAPPVLLKCFLLCGAEDLSLTLFLNPGLSITLFPVEEMARPIPNSLGGFGVFFVIGIFSLLLTMLLFNTA